MTEKVKNTGFVEIEIASCIDHTSSDIFDLSAEELRFLCRHYQPSYDAVSVVIPSPHRPKVVAVIHGGNFLSPHLTPAIKFLKPSQSPNLVLEDAHGGLDVRHHDHDPDHHNNDDVIDVDDEEDKVIDLVDDDDDDKKEYSIVASSVGSNDYVSDAMDDDAVSSPQYV